MTGIFIRSGKKHAHKKVMLLESVCKPTSLYFEMKSFALVSQACLEFSKPDSTIIISK